MSGAPLSARGRLDGALRKGDVRVGDGGWSVEVEVTDADRLGVSVRGVRVRGPERGDVVGQAQRLPEALGVLPDRVRPLEVDRALGGAVLRSRSRTPRGEDGTREYFEVRTDGREVSVEKLRAGPDGRAAVPFTLTREQLGRLVDDVGEVLAGEREG